MPMQPPKPTVPTSLPMYFMVSNIAKQGTTCTQAAPVRVCMRGKNGISALHVQKYGNPTFTTGAD